MAGSMGSGRSRKASEAASREGVRRPAGRGARPLVITEDVDLLDDVLRLCAAAGADPEVHHKLPDDRGSWERAPLVLVGDDAAARCRGAARRPGVMLVGREQDDPAVWQWAVEIGAECVLRLPEAEGWLADRLADAAEGAGELAVTVGVIGGRGGAGASTLACALAVTAARAGRRTTLVDADPLGGGLDVLLGGERAEGRRWPDFAASKGRVAGTALEEALPRLHDLSVLSWDRGEAVTVGPDAMRSVLAAARRRGGVVVVDLPRRIDEPVAEALAQLDVGLLVVPAELRAVAAAERVASMVRMVLRDLRAVVRGPCAAGLDETWIAEALDLSLVGELPPEPGLSELLDRGEPPGSRARGPLAVFCAEFWERALRQDMAPGLRQDMRPDLRQDLRQERGARS
ncbi:septum site-determining protein Ssd [Streptomyces sp. 8L]|uniref:septum site-determining protein Ssd n=1 Tax=Streptomyces sp. 8L TaxID=2877242 RepID=UPI001CD3EF70|nr:septum site-determining protein Ssd [Streptomyces sp. 8L]MCA1222974.1 septum formation initiator [Streptomyces sp. 8L]